MLERTKFAVYVVFAVVFAGVIYPLVGHWIWGGGWLTELGMQDFAGSTVVHLSGAMAALAGTLLLGPRLGKYDDERSEEHTSELQSRQYLVCRLLLEKKKQYSG